MLRIVLFYILPFLLPFIGFFAYRFLVTRGQPLLQNTPWFVLSIAGLLLVSASLVALAFTGGWERGGEYVPPRLEGGRIVPGEVRAPAGEPAGSQPEAAGPDDDG